MSSGPIFGQAFRVLDGKQFTGPHLLINMSAGEGQTGGSNFSRRYGKTHWCPVLDKLEVC